jgi:N6-adenosine-specific RNA methylase IME4
MRWSGGRVRRSGRGRTYVMAGKSRLPYPTLTVDEIAALPIATLVGDDAHLYLWAPDHFIITGDAARVARAWGFVPLRFLVWAKPGFGLGTFPRPAHELLLIARRGTLAFELRNVGSVQRWPSPYGRSKGVNVRLHSAKPEGAYALVERASPGPYLDLFARRPRLGWDAWGDESIAPVELEMARAADGG